MRWRSSESIQSRMSLGNAFPGARVCWIWPLVSYLQLEHRDGCRIGWDRVKVMNRHEPVACIASEYLALNELCQEKETERSEDTRATCDMRQGSCSTFYTVLARGFSEIGGRVRVRVRHRQLQSLRASFSTPRLLNPVKNDMHISQASEKTTSSRPSAKRICLLSHSLRKTLRPTSK